MPSHRSGAHRSGVNRSDTFEELARLRERFDALFEELLVRAGLGPAGGGASGSGPGALPGTWVPALDLLEAEGALLLRVELPGVDRDDVDLVVEGRRLELSGRRKALPTDHRFLQMERSYGRFQRAVDLPTEVDPDGIEADLDRGVLRVVLPKAGAARGPSSGATGR